MEKNKQEQATKRKHVLWLRSELSFQTAHSWKTGGTSLDGSEHVRRWSLLEEIGQCGRLAGGCTCLSLPGEVSSQFCHTLVPQCSPASQAQEWWQVEWSLAETPEAMSPHSHCSC